MSDRVVVRLLERDRFSVPELCGAVLLPVPCECGCGQVIRYLDLGQIADDGPLTVDAPLAVTLPRRQLRDDGLGGTELRLTQKGKRRVYHFSLGKTEVVGCD